MNDSAEDSNIHNLFSLKLCSLSLSLVTSIHLLSSLISSPSSQQTMQPCLSAKSVKSKNRHHFSSVAQSCPALCDYMNCSMPGFHVHHQLLELAQTYVHWVSDAIQPSHPLSSLSLPAFNLSHHQGLFQWVSSSLTKVFTGQSTGASASSFQRIWLSSFRIDWLDLLEVQGTLKSLL